MLELPCQRLFEQNTQLKSLCSDFYNFRETIDFSNLVSLKILYNTVP